MAKFRKELVAKIKEENKNQEEQIRLKEKHGIAEENVVVVEKDNMIKFFVRVFVSFVKLVATIGLLVLATIGLFTLVYPEIRTPFLHILNDILHQYFSVLF